MPKMKIRAVYQPSSVWESTRTVVIHCTETTTLEQAIVLAKEIADGKYQPYRRKYRVKSVNIEVVENGG